MDTPIHLLTLAATAVNASGAADLDAAYRVVCADTFKHLLARSAIAEWTGTGWTLRTATSPDSAIDQFIDRLNTGADPSAPFCVHQSGMGAVTLLPLQATDAPPLLLGIEGDWAYLRDDLAAVAPLLALGLAVVRERVARQENARLLVDGYAMIRRLSRSRSLEAVARTVVRETAQLVGAERVSLTLFDEVDQSLSIAASEGIAPNSLEGVRITRGDWVLGHVFASRRPVFVSDVTMLPGFKSNSATYRTCSFAAVPLLAGPEAVGVLAVTDKRGHAVFSRQDELVLRTLASAAAVAVIAARAGDEVTRLSHAATLDSLTGLLNRPGFDNRLHQEVERAKREAGPLAVLMGDVDDFKTINDTRGHQVGDEVLKLVGSVIRSSVRVFDVSARYGGDEFAVVMPNSDRENAVRCAERIRQRLAERSATEQLPVVTMSIGVTVIGEGDHVADLIGRADQSLYRAKADGKNLVRIHTSPADALPARRSGDVRVIDIAARREARQAPVAAENAAELRYVLVVDSHTERVSSCLQAVTPFRVGFLVARDGEQAAGIIARFGAPLLLVVDLSLPVNDGFALIERLREAHGDRSAVLAWAASRELREYASARLRAADAHVLAATAALPTIELAIARCLERRPSSVDAAKEKAPATWTAEQVHRVTSELSYRAKQISPAPGVAVYLRAPGEPTYRADVSWNSDHALPHSPIYLPRAFAEVVARGRTVASADLGMDGLSGRDAQDALRGVVGCPVIWAGEVIGALCVFDVAPLSMSDSQVATLEALARDVAESIAPVAAGLPSGALTVTRRSPSASPGGVADWPPALLERVGGEFAVARELARTRRERKELSVMLFEFAPLLGDTNLDQSLHDASEALLRAIRQSDVPIRWSGSEFLVVLPGLAGNAARIVAERVRAALQAAARHHVTVVGGVAELEDEEGFGEVVGRARQRVSLARGGS